MSVLVSFVLFEDVEQVFYEVIIKGDVDLLIQFWVEDEEMFCVYLIGVCLIGIVLIWESWCNIFVIVQLCVQVD